METKHTPGPWKYSTSQEGWSYTINIHQADDAQFTDRWSDVAYICQTCKGEEQQRQEANARLIASAPELLACLIALIPEVKQYRGSVLLVGTNVDMQCRLHDLLTEKIDAAQAAIAKATGAAQ